MLEKFCDILVIGNELPGLVTAAFLARRGLSVQVIDSDIFADHPKLPDPHCLCNVQSKLLRSILGRLNVPEVTIQNFLNQESTLQVIFPKHRIDVINNPLTYFEEIEREFAKEAPQLKTFYEKQAKLRHQTDVTELFQQLLPHSFKEKRLFRKFINEQNLNQVHQEYLDLLKLTPALARFMELQYLLAYQQMAQKPFNFQISELFNPGDGEIFSVHAGLKDLKKMLHDRIHHYDGVVRKKVQINQLLFRNGIFEGADLDENQGQILSKYMIWNTSLHKLTDYLPQKWRFRKLRKVCEQDQTQHHWFTARYSIDKNFIPEPMKTNAVVIRNEKLPLTDANMLYLQVQTNKMESLAHIDVHFLLPKSALEQTASHFEKHFEHIRVKLLEIFPFSDKNLKLAFPLRSPDQPQDTLFPLTEDDFEIFKHSAEQNGISEQTASSFLDLFEVDYQTPTPNFFISHPKVFSSFGIESKLILGLKITDLIWQEVEKVKKRAMRSERRIA